MFVNIVIIYTYNKEEYNSKKSSKHRVLKIYKNKKLIFKIRTALKKNI